MHCISLIVVLPYPMDHFCFVWFPPTGSPVQNLHLGRFRQSSESLGAGARMHCTCVYDRKTSPGKWTARTPPKKSANAKGRSSEPSLQNVCWATWGGSIFIFYSSNHCIRELGECQVFLQIFIPTKGNKTLETYCWWLSNPAPPRMMIFPLFIGF